MTEATKPKTLYCNFCGKSQHEVYKLIAGPAEFICDECVELCVDIIRENAEPTLIDVATVCPDLGTLDALLQAAGFEDRMKALEMDVTQLFERLAPLSARFAAEIKQSHAQALQAAKSTSIREIETELESHEDRIKSLREALTAIAVQ